MSNTDKQRRVLMISAVFPPAGGPGVQRTLKFAKYLPEHGWKPVVWTAGAIDELPLDDTLRGELPCEVRVVDHVPARSWHNHGGICAGHVRPKRTVRERLLSLPGIGRRAAHWRKKTAVPDHFVSWARACLAPTTALVERENIEVIYSTYSPASNHLLALHLKGHTNKPWVADFRDLWTDDYRYHEPSQNRRLAHRSLEQQFLEKADVVIGVSERQTEILASHVPGQRTKFLTITNGYDPSDGWDDAESGQPRQANTAFVLSHVGRADRWRTSDALFDGLQRFVATMGEERDRFLLKIVGHVTAEVRQRLHATGVTWSHTPYVPHPQAVEEMRRADALLLGVPDGPNGDSVIPAKAFEYLASGRPIIVVGPPRGESARLVQRCQAGSAVGFRAEAFAEVLKEYFENWLAGRPTEGCSRLKLDPLRRDRLTGRLADVFRSVAAPNVGAIRKSTVVEEEVVAV